MLTHYTMNWLYDYDQRTATMFWVTLNLGGSEVSRLERVCHSESEGTEGALEQLREEHPLDLVSAEAV